MPLRVEGISRKRHATFDMQSSMGSVTFWVEELQSLWNRTFTVNVSKARTFVEWWFYFEHRGRTYLAMPRHGHNLMQWDWIGPDLCDHAFGEPMNCFPWSGFAFLYFRLAGGGPTTTVDQSCRACARELLLTGCLPKSADALAGILADKPYKHLRILQEHPRNWLAREQHDATCMNRFLDGVWLLVMWYLVIKFPSSACTPCLLSPWGALWLDLVECKCVGLHKRGGSEHGNMLCRVENLAKSPLRSPARRQAWLIWLACYILLCFTFNLGMLPSLGCIGWQMAACMSSCGISIFGTAQAQRQRVQRKPKSSYLRRWCLSVLSRNASRQIECNRYLISYSYMCIFKCIMALCFQIRILKYCTHNSDQILTRFWQLPGCQGMYRVHSLRNIARLMRGYGFEGDDFDWEIMDSDLDSAEDVPRLQWSVRWQACVIFFHLRPCALLAARILMKGDPSLWSSRRWGFQYDAAWQHKAGKRWKKS